MEEDSRSPCERRKESEYDCVPCLATYQRRKPEHMVLHMCVTEHLPRFLGRCEELDRYVPRFVQREFEGFLRCGILDYGFARVHCPECSYNRLVAFSCKGRGFCPSCGARRMEDGAAHLCNEVLPPLIPYRQWVLSFPRPLRYLMAYNPAICRDITGILARVVFRFLRRQAKAFLRLKSVQLAHPGLLVVIQRFGSGLNLNVHLHALGTDGVYVLDDEGRPVFWVLPEPTHEELDQLAARICEEILDLLRRRGIWSDTEENEDPVDPLLGQLARASMTGTLAFGPEGCRAVRLGSPSAAQPPKGRAGHALGFNLDAAVRVAADDRHHREHLVRYLLRPPLAQGRLTERFDGNYAFQMRKPWPNGTSVLVFSGVELIARLAALVPPPKLHAVRYFGVFAPHSKLRPMVVPRPPVPTPSPSGCILTSDTEKNRYGRRTPWALLLQMVFGLDVLQCPRCSCRMQRIAFLTQPRVIHRFLDAITRQEKPP